ncbi:hypothetical protein [Natronomonas gomsonensis]|uniref:hypothetical protein n=1 Tax=Natronomonas gomsonensis TaxID=1046043 RepID=UPI0015B9ADD5|nr:hypothetical protein [Natronomonas gomsonensis]
MEGVDSGDGEVSTTSMDDNLLDDHEWQGPVEPAPDDSDVPGYDSGGYEFVGPESDANWSGDEQPTGDDPTLAEILTSGRAFSAAVFGENYVSPDDLEENPDSDPTGDPWWVYDGTVSPAEGAADSDIDLGTGTDIRDVDIPEELNVDLPGWLPWAAGGTLGTILLLVVIYVVGQAVTWNVGGDPA